MSTRHLCLRWFALLCACSLAAPMAHADAKVRVDLRNAALASTEQGRADLKYIAYCALDDQTVLVAQHAGRRYEFAGVVGLAPRWNDADMTPLQQQWVSACMLGLANHFGAKVEVSLMLHGQRPARVKPAWQDLSRQYPQPEGRYFGNLFADRPVAYVCSPRWTAAQQRALTERKRVCALPLAGKAADGPARTACGFVHVGECTDAAMTQGGQHFPVSVQVHLP